MEDKKKNCQVQTLTAIWGFLHILKNIEKDDR